MIEKFADWVTYTLLNLSPDSPAGSSVHFFIFDSIYVTIMMMLVVFFIAIIRSFITPQKIRKWLGGRHEGVGNVIAALLGIPTPFCSCSAVPMFIGFIESGVPLGVTFSFLIASPMINEIAATMLYTMFGWQIAALYIITGFIIAVTAGIIIGRLHLESEIEDFVYASNLPVMSEKVLSWKDRIIFAKNESKNITLRVLPYILLGIGVGGIIHGYAPMELLSQYAGPDNPFAVPLAVLIGIPLYMNAVGMIPILQVLTEKGVAMGTALAFMMAVIGLSVPEMIILRKVLKIRLLVIFAGILFVAITMTGIIFNMILG
ncbi:permease [Methanospirillum lacunae]|uniref:Permease n=1 Tax=Methanospirillum lacunae TaxID=668570 RepID=A0A2V2N6Z5_9EURY|nr:permease [Methanospirillum lacunae]PWR71043.1 hypothetical protein DK846_13225 [Methanospirillum lacunae]